MNESEWQHVAMLIAGDYASGAPIESMIAFHDRMLAEHSFGPSYTRLHKTCAAMLREAVQVKDHIFLDIPLPPPYGAGATEITDNEQAA